MSAFQKTFEDKIVPELKKDLKVKNINEIPRMKKVVVNIGIGTFMKNNKDYQSIADDLAAITGQKPQLRKARISVSNFKLREGMPNGLRVTLRGSRMYDFMFKLINTALPRVRDFQGVPTNSFDGTGNYTLGLKDHTIFPEINIDDNTKNFGLEITVVTSTNDDEHARVLLKHLGMPFKKAKSSK